MQEMIQKMWQKKKSNDEKGIDKKQYFDKKKI